MKKIIYILLLLPCSSFGQCPRWIGSSADSALMLEKVAERFLQVTLSRANEKKDKSNIDFTKASCLCEFLYSVSKQKTKGVKGNRKHLAVNKILITGPEDKVKEMYTEYFYPLLKPCSATVQPTALMNNDMSVSYYLLTMHGKKLAEIILHK